MQVWFYSVLFRFPLCSWIWFQSFKRAVEKSEAPEISDGNLVHALMENKITKFPRNFKRRELPKIKLNVTAELIFGTPIADEPNIPTQIVPARNRHLYNTRTIHPACVR
ncbi:uncharacterized protein LOC125766914 [Anopheles funestus]|uniref:uncharacterized protein LOC125766914 n=1 Tax=Anopheles funestus TaxID=62324 RepID=UPI0020C5EFDF|nr:uncharacterized protein LOC125766914 [Anopheles funestus]